MKRILTIALSLALGVALLMTGCQKTNTPAESGGGDASTGGTKKPSSSATTESGTEPTQPAYEQLDMRSVAINNADISDEALEASYLNQGNLARLARVMEKAEKGEKVVIGAFGGSITEGMSASVPGRRYSSQVLLWLRETYPNGDFELVNAGIGSTGSIIGGGRMEEDLLSKNPDLIIVEFACNDGVTALEVESYEGVVRRALEAPNQPAVMLLFMTRNDGGSSQDSEIPVGRKYDLPMISYRNCVVKGMADKAFKWEDISPDVVHPNDRGHAIAARLITHRLELVKNHLAEIDKTIPELPASDTRFMNQTLRNSQNYTPKSLGSFAPATKQYYNASLSKGWEATAGNSEPLVFETESKVVTLVFRRLVTTRGAKVNVKVDGRQIMTVDADFPNGFGEYADLKTIIERDNTEKCTVELSIDPSSPQGSKFMLLGIIE